MEHITGNFYRDFSEGRHDYFLIKEGKSTPLTGVTSIISVLSKGDNLVNWAARMAVESIQSKLDEEGVFFPDVDWKLALEEAKNAHTKKKEAAGVHGTGAHALVEEYINICIKEHRGCSGFPIDEKFRDIDKFIQWSTNNVDHFLFSERPLHSPTLYVAGTADFGYIDKQARRIMGDLKTASGIYGIEFWLQTAAYRMLAEEEGDTPYDGCIVVRMGKKSPQDFEVISMYDYETCKNAFLACLTLYRAQAALKGAVVK